MMELYYSWYSTPLYSSQLFFLVFKDHDLYKFVWFFAILQIWYNSCMYIKSKKEQIWKCVWSTNELIDNRMENMIIIFLSDKLWFTMQHFYHEFICLDMFFFPLLYCNLHSLKVLHNKWCSPHFIMWNKTIEKNWSWILRMIVFMTLVSSMMYHMKFVKTISWPSQIMIWN